MASDSEEPSYSSPPKRFKLDDSFLSIPGKKFEMDIIHISASNSAMDLRTENDLFKLKNPEDVVFKRYGDEIHPPSDIVLRNSIPTSNSRLSVVDEVKTGALASISCNDAREEVVPVDTDQDDGDDDDNDDDDDDEVSSTVSDLSDLSGLSNISGQDWKGIAGPMSWVHKQMANGVDPRVLLSHLMGDKFTMDKDLSNLDNISLWKIIVHLLSEPPHRVKLRHINTLDDVIHLLRTCSKIIVLTGAGVSVSCGIPDFRSRDGIYSRLALDFPNLPDPQAMFDINYFRQDPRPFFKFAREIYPGQFKPSPCHRFIKLLEEKNKLLRNYSQNIDTLEQVAGIKNVVECHGSFATASCTNCSHKVTSDDIKEQVFQQRIPMCVKCSSATEYRSGSQGVMKPDIVFFGEGLPESFHRAMAEDKDECDLLIVIGSSLKVRPVALIPSSLPGHVPQVLINRERLPYLNFDIELLGDGDVIIDHLCRMLGDDWTKVCWRSCAQTETSYLLPPSCRSGYNSECSEEGEMSVDWSSVRGESTVTDSVLHSRDMSHRQPSFVNSHENKTVAVTDDNSCINMEADDDAMADGEGLEEEVLLVARQTEEHRQKVTSVAPTDNVQIMSGGDVIVSTAIEHRKTCKYVEAQPSSVRAAIPSSSCSTCGECGKLEVHTATSLSLNSSIKCRKKRRTKASGQRALPSGHVKHQIVDVKEKENSITDVSKTVMDTAERKEPFICGVEGDASCTESSQDVRMSIDQQEDSSCEGRVLSNSISSSASFSCSSSSPVSCMVAPVGSHRHLSMDSTRDSGIGDGSNSSLSAAERHMSVDSHSDSVINLASRLPENTYYFIRPNRYIFQGAEVMDKEELDNNTSSDSSDTETDAMAVRHTVLSSDITIQHRGCSNIGTSSVMSLDYYNKGISRTEEEEGREEGRVMIAVDDYEKCNRQQRRSFIVEPSRLN